VALPLANRRNAAGMNHFHFHAEHLCALLQLEKLRAARPELEFETLLPAYDAVQAEAVALLAPDLGPRGPVGEAELEARLLLVPSLSFHSRSGPDPVVAEVFARLRARLGQPGAGASHVYVSRFDASKRRLDNETALAERLRERGFAIFEARGRSYREQALALAGARVIVGPHGAGLTNIGFAAPGALLVEILPAFLVPGYFRRLAGALGHLYRCFTQPAAASPGGDMPWTLDLDAFLRFLDPLLDES
jgi:capsular polysaccharide biosynthesis protein